MKKIYKQLNDLPVSQLVKQYVYNRTKKSSLLQNKIKMFGVALCLTDFVFIGTFPTDSTFYNLIAFGSFFLTIGVMWMLTLYQIKQQEKIDNNGLQEIFDTLSQESIQTNVLFTLDYDCVHTKHEREQFVLALRKKNYFGAIYSLYHLLDKLKYVEDNQKHIEQNYSKEVEEAKVQEQENKQFLQSLGIIKEKEINSYPNSHQYLVKHIKQNL